jgi:GTP pyrophosphokinase
MTFTSGARHQIKRWLNQQEKSRAVALGRKLWDRETAKTGRKGAVPVGDDLRARLSGIFPSRIHSLDDFFALVGRGKIVLTRKLFDRVGPAGEPGRPKRRPRVLPEIQVQKRSPELVRLARCCRPIKGEPVIGYLTAGKGITVHALRCLRVTKELLVPERLVDVSWGKVTPSPSRAGLVIKAANVRGLLAKITAAISGQGADIDRAAVSTSPDDTAEVKLDLTVRDIKHLEGLVKAVARIEGVRSVGRT